MKNFLNINSPIMRFLGKVADLMILNALTLVCCLPILTAGCAVTAMHTVVLKIHREEEPAIAREFFSAFKRNLKPATLLWLVYLFFAVLCLLDCYYVFWSGVEFQMGFKILFFAMAAVFVLSITWGFVLLSRYEVGLRQTLINTCLIAISYPVKTIGMALLWMTPWYLLYAYPPLIPVILLMGLSLPARVEASAFSEVFQKLEEQKK